VAVEDRALVPDPRCVAERFVPEFERLALASGFGNYLASD
jgi:acetoacetate decarboxylase